MKRLGIAFLMVLAGGCGQQQLPEKTASWVEIPTPTTVEVAVGEPPVPPTTTLPLVATVTEPPVRLPAFQAATTLPPPPFDPVAYVNALPYDYVEGREQAATAFTIVAAANGWSDSKINGWSKFILDVIAKESGYCPNLRRGAIVSSNGCQLIRQGTGEDAGFGQLTSVHHGRNQWLCTGHGVCGANAVISSPWISMSSVVWLLDREGSKPWCWSDWARSFHNCSQAPDR